jgi:hypothetical protein
VPVHRPDRAQTGRALGELERVEIDEALVCAAVSGRIMLAV